MYVACIMINEPYREMNLHSLFVLFFILKTQVLFYNCEVNSNKEEKIEKIMKLMNSISKTISKNTISLDPDSVLEEIRPFVVYSSTQYTNSKSYTDLIMKGFQLILLESSDKTAALRNNIDQVLPKLISIEPARALNMYHENNGHIISEDSFEFLDDIIDKIKYFAKKHSVTFRLALNLIKYRNTKDYKNSLYRRYLPKNATQKYNESKKTNNLVRKHNIIDSNDIFTSVSSPITEISNTPPFSKFSNISQSKITVTAFSESLQCFFNNCLCKGNVSVSLSNNCFTFCRQTCTQKLNLQQWTCKSFNGSDSIHLNFICDGFIDCKDESDENECNYNSDKNLQFQSNKLFKDLLQPLANPDKEKIFIHFRLKLRALYNRVKDLIKNSAYQSSKGDIKVISLRHDLIKEICIMHDEAIQRINDDRKLAKIYTFFNNIKVEVVRALKLSTSGNVRSIPEGQCVCRENVCGIPKCSLDCQRICSRLFLFDRYRCSFDKNGTFITIKQLCDGKYDCNKYEDEIFCRKEPCRSHHLMALRKKIVEFSHKSLEEIKDSRLQNTLQLWIIKVTDNLKYEEIKLKENRKSFISIITEILMNLALEYRNYEEMIKDSNGLAKFAELSQIIVQTKRSCGI